MKPLISIICIVSVMSACKSHDYTDGKLLSHTPTGEVNVTISNVIIKVDFSLDKEMMNVITSEVGQDKLGSIKTREQLIDFYDELIPLFQPGYSSLSDDNHYVFTKVEYLLAQECFQSDCSSRIRKKVLETAIDKQKQKFGKPYIDPCFTRRTGVFLIATILLNENDDSFIQALNNGSDLLKTLSCLNNNTWMDDEEYNNQLIQFAEDFLTTQ